ncbi:hypothetical protein Zmor_026588 [Zophobas morio]|uniref:Uncharacterized protein n=1 Tax=Zophobas morio TaxID=2755281 RepID=A0AA38HUP7_9CUCU|nr:hypothetical protein Zmor_026588 [Zophobas morio]
MCNNCTRTSNDPPVTAAIIEGIVAKQLELLKNQLQQSMDDHFKRLNDRISTVENNVKVIQEEWDDFKKSSASFDLKLNDVVSEIEERKQRSCNVMLFNIPESSATDIAHKVAEDLSQVLNILSPLGTYPQPNKIIRLGVKKPDTNRPLKIIYDSEITANNILKSNKLNNNRDHHFKPDLTLMQRQYNNRIRKEFNNRVANGETDITLKYKNNTPCIEKKKVRGTTSKK